MAQHETTTKRLTVRKPTPPSAKAPAKTPRRSRRGAGLPGWAELSGKAGKAEPAPERGRAIGRFETVSTLRVALLLLAAAAAFTLYVGHVHATQMLLTDVQQLRKDNVRLHMKYNRLKGEFDRRVGPAVIYDRARALGLEEDIRYAPTVTVE